jgi:DNA-binding transcriptional LysR family regulator
MTRPLDSRQLLAFVCAAHRMSFTLAAEELHLTQSAISHAMRALEEDLGCRLFTRGGRKVQLTGAGERFLPDAERILGEMEQARFCLTADADKVEVFN